MTLRDRVIDTLRGAGITVVAVSEIRPSAEGVAVVRPAGITPDGYASVEITLAAPPAAGERDPDRILDAITIRAWQALAGEYQEVAASGPVTIAEPELQGVRQSRYVGPPPAPAMAIVVTDTCRLQPTIQ